MNILPFALCFDMYFFIIYYFFIFIFYFFDLHHGDTCTKLRSVSINTFNKNRNDEEMITSHLMWVMNSIKQIFYDKNIMVEGEKNNNRKTWQNMS